MPSNIPWTTKCPHTFPSSKMRIVIEAKVFSPHKESNTLLEKLKPETKTFTPKMPFLY